MYLINLFFFRLEKFNKILFNIILIKEKLHVQNNTECKKILIRK